MSRSHTVARALSERIYRGMSLAQRRSRRRARLIQAARELWCEQGWAGVSMRAVCAKAGLTDRYFYESFTDRDAVLVAVGESVREETVALLAHAIDAHADASPIEQLQAALQTIVDFIAEDPGSAQIFFGDHGGNEVLQELRRSMVDEIVGMFVAMMRPHFLPGINEEHYRVTALVGIGGFIEAATAWRSNAIDLDAVELVQLLTTVAESLTRPFIDLQ